MTVRYMSDEEYIEYKIQQSRDAYAKWGSTFPPDRERELRRLLKIECNFYNREATRVDSNTGPDDQ